MAISFEDQEVIGHRVKALRLAPERLHDRMNLRWKLPHFPNQPLECSRCRWTEDLDEPPRRARCAAGQERQTRADDSKMREQRAQLGTTAGHPEAGGRAAASASAIRLADRRARCPRRCSGWRAAYARTTKLPNECPTSTYRSPGATSASTVESSSTMRSKVLGHEGASLQARPAQSYAQTRVNFAISGRTIAQLSDDAAIRIPAARLGCRSRTGGVQSVTADIDQETGGANRRLCRLAPRP